MFLMQLRKSEEMRDDLRTYDDVEVDDPKFKEIKPRSVSKRDSLRHEAFGHMTAADGVDPVLENELKNLFRVCISRDNRSPVKAKYRRWTQSSCGSIAERIFAAAGCLATPF